MGAVRCLLGYDFTRFKDGPFWDSRTLEDLRQLCAIRNDKCFFCYCYYKRKQANSARERGLCQLPVCFEFQSRSE